MSLEGLLALTAPGTVAFAAPEIEAWVRGTIERGDTLWEAASRHAERTLTGRGPVPVLRTPRGRWVVRRYRRGGLVAGPLLVDRYLRAGPPRPHREARASAEARRRGIATPRVVGGAVYAAGPFYRADLVTEWIPDSVDLADALFAAPRAEGADEATVRTLRSVGSLVARAAAAGIEHPDLNARNVLLDRSGGDASPVLLDLDRCRVLPPGVTGDPAPMLARLERSLRKLGRRANRPLDTRALRALREGAR